MKRTNRKRMNVLVAAVVCIILAGSAFAFVSRGPLLFQGTVTADANLEMQIMPDMAGHAREIPVEEALRPAEQKNRNASGGTGLVTLHTTGGLLPVTFSGGGTNDRRTATFGGIEFNGPAAARISFRVENIGTMPTRFVRFEEEISHYDADIEVSFDIVPWSDYDTGANPLVARDLNNIQPGEFFWVNMDIALIDGGNNYELLGEILSFEVEMHYAMGESITFGD